MRRLFSRAKSRSAHRNLSTRSGLMKSLPAASAFAFAAGRSCRGGRLNRPLHFMCRPRARRAAVGARGASKLRLAPLALRRRARRARRSRARARGRGQVERVERRAEPARTRRAPSAFTAGASWRKPAARALWSRARARGSLRGTRRCTRPVALREPPRAARARREVLTRAGSSRARARPRPRRARSSPGARAGRGASCRAGRCGSRTWPWPCARIAPTRSAPCASSERSRMSSGRVSCRPRPRPRPGVLILVDRASVAEDICVGSAIPWGPTTVSFPWSDSQPAGRLEQVALQRAETHQAQLPRWKRWRRCRRHRISGGDSPVAV